MLAPLANSAHTQTSRARHELVNLPLHLNKLAVPRHLCGKAEPDVQAAIWLRGPGSEAHFCSQLSRSIQSQRNILGECLAYLPEGCREEPLIQRGRSETLAVIETIREGLHPATSPGRPWSQLQCGPG